MFILLGGVENQCGIITLNWYIKAAWTCLFCLEGSPFNGVIRSVWFISLYLEVNFCLDVLILLGGVANEVAR